MSTSRQRAANRRNSQLSTGPRTLRGRAAVAANPLTHGFYARIAVPDLEDPADYHAVLADYLADLRPAGAVEVELVHRYVKDLWKLRRIERLERIYFVESIQRNERYVIPEITAPDQRASLACFESINEQFLQFKTVAPLERIAVLGHRLRRGLDATLRLLRELQAERFASAAPGETPFAVLDTLPSDNLVYTYDADNKDPAPAAPPSLEPPAAEPCAIDPRPARSGESAAPSSLLDALSPQPASSTGPTPSTPSSPAGPDTPPSAPSTSRNSAETPPASPTIHKPNPGIGFAPSKTPSTPPPTASNPRSRRSSKHPVHPRPR